MTDKAVATWDDHRGFLDLNCDDLRDIAINRVHDDNDFENSLDISGLDSNISNTIVCVSNRNDSVAKIFYCNEREMAKFNLNNVAILSKDTVEEMLAAMECDNKDDFKAIKEWVNDEPE